MRRSCSDGSGARWSRRWPRSFASPRISIAATPRRSPASSSTIGATMRCCRCARRATPNSSCGPLSAHAAPFERMIGKPLRVEVSKYSYAEQPDATPRISGQAVRRRGDRRLGENDAAGPAGEVAGSRRPPRVRHRMELVGARQGRHQNREEEERPDADDVQPAARHRLRG